MNLPPYASRGTQLGIRSSPPPPPNTPVSPGQSLKTEPSALVSGSANPGSARSPVSGGGRWPSVSSSSSLSSSSSPLRSAVMAFGVSLAQEEDDVEVVIEIDEDSECEGAGSEVVAADVQVDEGVEGDTRVVTAHTRSKSEVATSSRFRSRSSSSSQDYRRNSPLFVEPGLRHFLTWRSLVSYFVIPFLQGAFYGFGEWTAKRLMTRRFQSRSEVRPILKDAPTVTSDAIDAAGSTHQRRVVQMGTGISSENFLTGNILGGNSFNRFSNSFWRWPLWESKYSEVF